MKKKNGFKPSEMEGDIQSLFSSVLSSAPTKKRVKSILEDVKDVGQRLEAKRKTNQKRLIKK